jgi:outer membrane scaffolding protein for murein synthesis (MipA/OmpV family)
MKSLTRHHCLLSLTLLFSASSPFCQLAAQEFRWEAGVGTVAANLPLYPGSSQTSSYVIPFPYLRIESEYLDIDQGVKSKLFKSSNLRFSLSGGLGVPVNSADSNIRTGMPDLDLVLQLGPSLDIVFDNDKTDAREWRMELPLRVAIATDFSHTQNIGWLLEPRLVYDSDRLRRAGWAYEFTAGMRFATDKYHAYYYDVAPQYATPVRPAFESSGGYSGLFTDLIASWRKNSLIYFAWARYQYLGGSVYEDSPLVEDTSYIFVGVGLSWIFAESL